MMALRLLYSIVLAWTLWQGTYSTGSWSAVVTYSDRDYCESQAEEKNEYWDGRSPNVYTFVCVPSGVHPDRYVRMGGGRKAR